MLQEQIQTAIDGLTKEHSRLQAAIATLEGLLPEQTPAVVSTPKHHRRFSPAARARISKAMKARWAEVRRAQPRFGGLTLSRQRVASARKRK